MVLLSRPIGHNSPAGLRVTSYGRVKRPPEKAVAVRPTVFLSSTVRDFRDLRGAVKHWLEDSGFEALASDYADFDMRPDESAFDACFDAVRRSDFYILLLGFRRGSWYRDSISVTQQEYRVARESFEAYGAPIPILLIRREVQTLLRAGLTESSDFEDASHTRRFVEEVSATFEVTEEKSEPIERRANWLHDFDSFRDVVDVLRVALDLKSDLSRQRRLNAVAAEVETLLAHMMLNEQVRATPAIVEATRKLLIQLGIKETEADALIADKPDWTVRFPMPRHAALDLVVERHPLSSERERVELDAEDAGELFWFLLAGLAAPEAMRMEAVWDAARTGAFLDYDRGLRAFGSSELSTALSDVLADTVRYGAARRAVEPYLAKTLGELVEPINYGRRTYLDGDAATFIWAVHHVEANLYLRLAALYDWLNRRRDSPLPGSLYPLTPLGDEQVARILDETVTVESLRLHASTPGYLTTVWEPGRRQRPDAPDKGATEQP